MKYDIKKLTLEEKMKLLTGKDNWQLETANGKLPQVFLSDGPNGLRMHDVTKPDLPQKKATAMPNIHLLANSWDTELAYLDGATIADDCIENGADVLLAPGVNIKRTPLCGRNFEYFSEDPYLAGMMAKAYIEGVQSKGIGVSVKHFCCNNREYDRFYQTSEVDERTLREIYLPAFEIAAQAKPWTVMCSYNTVNGVWASEHAKNYKILREEFGFDGMVVSDWGAVHSGWRAVKAGTDLRMPYHANAYEELKTAYDSGLLTEAEIDTCVDRVLALIDKTQNDKKIITTTKEQRHENAVKIAKECMVLLKNEDGVLPLKKGMTVALVGGDPHTISEFNAMGGGGSAFVETAFCQECFFEYLPKIAPDIRFVHTGTFTHTLWAQMEKMSHLRLARGADAAIVFAATGKLDEREGADRVSIRLAIEQEDMILRTAEINPNTVVVLMAGSAIDVSPWIDKVKGVLFAGFAGETGTEAVSDILLGNANPCGKLSETFPLCLEDTPTGAYRGDANINRYTEGLLVGYRHYDTKNLAVAFPFGHGLSYAKFEYSNLKIEKTGETDYAVSYDITNVSSVDGKEISQVYVRDIFSNVFRPDKELKGFAKTALKAGETKRVCVTLHKRSFAFWSTALDKWQVENGEFEILVGASSRDIRLQESVFITLPDNEQYTLS